MPSPGGSVGEFFVKLSGDSKHLTDTLDKASKAIESSMKGLSKFAHGYAIAIAAPLTAFGTAAVVAAAKLESLHTPFEKLLGDSKAATKFLNDLTDIANSGEFGFDTIVEGGKRLLQFGTSAERAKEILLSVADAAAALGSGDAGLQGMIQAFAVMESRGRATTRAIAGLALQGVPAWEMLAEELGVNVVTAIRKVEEGAVSADEAMNAIVSGMKARWAGTMEQQLGETETRWKKLKEAIVQFNEAIGASIIEHLHIREILGAITEALRSVQKWWTSLDEQHQKTLISIGALAAGLGTLLLAIEGIGKIITVFLIPALVALIKFFAGPVGIIAVVLAGVAATAAYVVSIRDNIEASEAFTVRLDKMAGSYEYIEPKIKRASDAVKEFYQQQKKGAEGLQDIDPNMWMPELDVENLPPEAREQAEKLVRLFQELTKSAKDITEEARPGFEELEDAMMALEEKTIEEMMAIEALGEVSGKSFNKYSAQLDVLIKQYEELRKLGISKEDPEAQFIKAQIASERLKAANYDTAESLYALNEAYDLQGGGVNKVQGAIEILSEKYRFLSDQLRNETDPAIRSSLNFALEETQIRLESLQTPLATFVGKLQEIPAIGVQIGIALYNVFTQFTSGIGQAVARFIVYNEDLGKAMKNLFKQIASNIIATLIQIGIQWIALKILGLALNEEVAASSIGTNIARAGTAAYAAAIESMGIWGVIAGAGIAAAAIGIATGIGTAGYAAGAGVATAGKAASIGAAAGSQAGWSNKTGMASGGFITGGPVQALIGEAGTEIISGGTVMPLRDSERFMGGGDQLIQVILDERVIAEVSARGQPEVLRLHGVTT